MADHGPQGQAALLKTLVSGFLAGYQLPHASLLPYVKQESHLL